MTGVEKLSEVLQIEESQLNNIDLSGNEFGIEGAKALGEAFLLNEKLIKIDISNNQSLNEASSVFLFRGIAANKSLFRFLRFFLFFIDF